MTPQNTLESVLKYTIASTKKHASTFQVNIYMHNKHSPNKQTVYSVYCAPSLQFYNHTHEQYGAPNVFLL